MWISFLSNAAMLLPAGFLWKTGQRAGAALMLAALVASCFYHLNEKSPAHFFFDLVCVVLIVAYIIHVLMQAHAVFTYMNMVAVALGMCALFFWTAPCDPAEEGVTEAELAAYDSNHAAWHVVIALALFALAPRKYSSTSFASSATSTCGRGSLFVILVSSKNWLATGMYDARVLAPTVLRRR